MSQKMVFAIVHRVLYHLLDDEYDDNIHIYTAQATNRGFFFDWLKIDESLELVGFQRDGGIVWNEMW